MKSKLLALLGLGLLTLGTFAFGRADVTPEKAVYSSCCGHCDGGADCCGHCDRR